MSKEKSINIVYDSKWTKRIGKVIETKIEVNFEEFPTSGWRLIEKDSEGNIIDNSIVFQYDALNDITLSCGILAVYLKGENNSPRRYFELLLDDKAIKFEPAIVIEDENLMWEDELGYKIVTPVCTYIYHKECGGFASLLDNEGNDWISYRNYGGSDGAYRGIPNLVFTSIGGTFHPGRLGCSSEIICRGPIKVSIVSTSAQWGFKVRWDIYPEYATMTVLECSIGYWFLYEGTPGGNFDEENDYLVLANGETKPANEIWHGYGIPWLIFADSKTDRGLFVILKIHIGPWSKT